MNRTRSWTISGALAALSLFVSLVGCSRPSSQQGHPLAGKTIDISILGIDGWPPSRLGVDMGPLFSQYAKANLGYDVTLSFTGAPVSDWYKEASSSLAAKSQKYHLIVVDSQWLGSLAEPGWIVRLNDLIEKNPELSVEWHDRVVVDSYMKYPDGSDQLWGLPEEGDVIVLFARQDLFADPKERSAFNARYGTDLPQTFEDWEKVTMTDFEKIAEFFTRPDDGLWGTAMQYSKEYDFMTMFLYPFMFSLGGDVWDPETRDVYGILNRAVNAKAMAWNKRMLRYMPPGASSYGIGEEVEAFTQGKLATAFQWAALGQVMITPEMRQKGQVIVVPPPAFRRDDGTAHRIYSIGGQPWVVNAASDEAHRRAVVDYLKWWYLPETQLEFAKRGGNPCVKAVLDSPGFDDLQPWFRAYRYMLRSDRARDFWHVPEYAELLAVQQEGWTAFATGQVTDAKKTLEWIACQQQRILFEKGRTQTAPPTSCKGSRLQ